MSEYNFDIALLSKEEVQLLMKTPPNECSICEWIISKGLFKSTDGNWFVTIEQLDNSDIEHLEQIIKRKLGDGIIDQLIVNGRYTSNQS